jgi:hypothetical protein
MKKLLIYMEDGDFVIERVNEFNHAFKRSFISEQGFLEGLMSYLPVIDEYEMRVSEDLLSLVVYSLNIEEF